MYDKEYVKKLAAGLDLELDDELAEVILKNIIEWSKPDMLKAKTTITSLNYKEKVNCSNMKEDKPIQPKEDVLTNCKKADKYVVGK